MDILEYNKIEFLIVSFNIVCSLYGAYTDIRIGKIRNWLNFGLFFFNLVMGILMIFVMKTLTMKLMITSLIVGIILSFFSYYVGIWAPVDAKLFGVCFIGLSISFHNIINPFNILFNIMFVPFLSVIYQGFVKTSITMKINTIRKIFDKKSFLKIILFINIFSSIAFNLSRLLYRILDALQIFAICLGILFLTGRYLNQIYERYKTYFYAIAFVSIIHNCLRFSKTSWVILTIGILAVMLVEFLKSVDPNIFYLKAERNGIDQSNSSSIETIIHAEQNRNAIKRTMVFGPYISFGVILTALLQGENIVLYSLILYRTLFTNIS